MAEAGLRIAPTLALPLDIITQTTVILAKKGAGKTNTAVVMVEEASKSKQQVLVVDPTGAWYGIRSSADGERPGFPFVVFGGEHGDVPLEDTAGELVATAFVEQGFSAVIDLSLFRKAQLQRFMAIFLETIYRLNRNAMLMVIDEADSVAPQKPFGEEARTLGAMQDLVRRGRIRGIGCVMITQRPQVLNKDVLTQADMLVALRMSHPKDMAAVKEWVDVHADPAVAREMLVSLPSLPTGTAWFWAPDRDLFARVQVRRRETFDSSATPKPGERKVEPKALAKIDLQKLGSDIAATIQKQKENSPAELKRRITELESALKRTPVPDDVAIRASQQAAADVEAENTALRERIADIRGKAEELHEFIDEQVSATVVVIKERITEASIALGVIRSATDVQLAIEPKRPVFPTSSVRTPLPASKTSTPQVQPVPIKARPGSPMGKALRSILTVLAQHGPSSKSKVAAVAGYAIGGGGFNNSLSQARTEGWLSGSDTLQITSDGRKALGSYQPLPGGRALLDQWLSRVGKAEREILLALSKRPLSKGALATQTGYAANGGGFNNSLSRLRTLELIEGRDPIALSPDFAEAIR